FRKAWPPTGRWRLPPLESAPRSRRRQSAIPLQCERMPSPDPPQLGFSQCTTTRGHSPGSVITECYFHTDACGYFTSDLTSPLGGCLAQAGRFVIRFTREQRHIPVESAGCRITVGDQP